MTKNVKRKRNGAASTMLARSTKSYYKRSDDAALQNVQLAGTCPAHAGTQAGARNLVKLRRTYSRDVISRRTKPTYRKRYYYVYG